MGESPTKRAFNYHCVPETSVTINDGLVDSIRHLLFTDTICNSMDKRPMKQLNI